jgi:Na+/proline symporter/signal transduction histidine kinase
VFSPLTVLLVLLVYFGLLFLLAQWVEGSSSLSKKISGSPVVYGLSLAVYATSWTYYGSVGKAATSGMLFSTVYIGPTLTIILWWQIMRRMVRIKNRYRITSIADFISARYDRSTSLAALAACAALVGTTPYIALQIKSVVATFTIIAGDPGPASSWVHDQIGPITVMLMITFTIMFGVRRIDPTERHQGMITAVAVESLVKLTAFLACGIFVTYIAHNGLDDLFHKTRTMGHDLGEIITLSGKSETPYATWATYMVLSMSAIMFLPRQFHVAVVENADEKHIATAMWLFPLYMLLISLFVVPIALDGLRIGLAETMADTYVLRLPMWYDRPWLALFVYIGGVSAAMSMVMISSMTLSTMLTNHIVLPVIRAVKPLEPLRRHLLRIKWVGVALVILTGYWFETAVGDSFMLVNMGMISFAAALQFAPPILGGIFWERGNKTGAQLGLISGFAIWFYTLVIPAFAQSGWAFQSLVRGGPLGIGLLKPEALFGMVAMDPLSQSVFWSMLFNIGLYMAGSTLSEHGATGMTLAKDFVNILDRGSGSISIVGKATIDLKAKTKKILATLTGYVPPGEAETMFVACIRRVGLSGRSTVSLTQLAELLGEVEKTLSGTVGAAEAHSAIMSAEVYTSEEKARLSNMYAEILADLKLTPGELKRRVDYYRDRESVLSRQATELETRVKARTRELEAANKELEAFSYSVSHDLRTPLRAIDGFSLALIEDYEDKLDAKGLDFLGRIRKASQRMGELIDDILTLSRMTRMEMERKTVDLSRTALEVVEAILESTPEPHVNVHIQPGLTAEADERLVRLLLENLLGNARKFSAGSDNPTISFGTEERLGTTWFVVRDNGAGFDMQYADRLFQAFSRLHSQDEFEGTGIGLAIVDRIIRKHGGRIRAEGQVGKGAAFLFTLQEE